MNQVLDCRKYRLGRLTGTLSSRFFFRKRGTANWSTFQYGRIWSRIPEQKDMGQSDFASGRRALKNRTWIRLWLAESAWCVQPVPRPEKPTQQLSGQSWQKEVTCPLHLASPRLRFENVPVWTSSTLAWFWEVGINTRRTHGNGKKTGKFALRAKSGELTLSCWKKKRFRMISLWLQGAQAGSCTEANS